jgi:hypothetical protein
LRSRCPAIPAPYRNWHADEFSLASHPELAIDPGSVLSGCLNADLQGERDFAVGFTSAKTLKHVGLAWREGGRIHRVGSLDQGTIARRKHSPALRRDMNGGENVGSRGVLRQTASSGGE